MIRELALHQVPERVRTLLQDPARLERMRVAMLAAAKPDAAEEIAEGLIALATA
jgi:UDP-N-acetylglucosamine:LPS N-acetylglucosamine transferase